MRERRDGSSAMIVVLLCVQFALHLGIWAPEVGWVAMAALFVCEVVRAASQIVYFRLGR